MFNCARDNAISALGKIIKHQSANVSDIESLVDFWIYQLPIKNDTD